MEGLQDALSWGGAAECSKMVEEYGGTAGCNKMVEEGPQNAVGLQRNVEGLQCNKMVEECGGLHNAARW
jgi:hypothetical protein